MKRLALAFVLLIPAWVSAGPPKDGTYELATRLTAASESIAYLIKLETKDGKLTGELVANAESLQDVDLRDVTLDGDILRFAIKTSTGTSTFEGRVPPDGAKEILGSFGAEARYMPTRLRISDRTTIGARPAVNRLTIPKPMQDANALSSRPTALALQIQRTQDADEKAKLQAEQREAIAKANAELPKLYMEVIEKHADSPAAVDAAMTLIRRSISPTAKPEADEVRKWAKLVSQAANAYGARYEADMAFQLTELLGAKKELAAIALDFASQAEKALEGSKNFERQDRVLTAIATAQRNAGQIAAADATDLRLVKINEILDKEYLEKMPPFKPAAYAGRKAKSDRIAVMELFTGAQCPPCVAADLAFDGLESTYKPTELALIQYHVHIPGPDPLTNPDSEARFAYYRGRFADKVRGAPTTVFNGEPKAGGGGAIANAEKKYKEYREIIDAALEEPAKATIALNAKQIGDAITFKADVSNVTEPNAKKKLRFILVEDKVRYVGGNRIRFHHLVVRAMPGGTDGMELKDTTSSHTATVKLGELKKDLTKYLDDFQTRRPFPKRDRPMTMEHLKAIAIVQDDETGEILQAAIVPIDGRVAVR